jgi:cytoskeleton protein RodZ
MKTVGKQLQDARMAKGWSPEMAARETKIRLERLRELEDDDYSNFSSPTYARGFVRTYARALGIDEYRILRQLDNKLPEDDNATFINDTGVPYMPEPSQVSKPFQVGRGVYIAGAVGAAMLLLIGFILVESYRAGYFASVQPSPTALPVTVTNALPVVPDTETARALPADSNAAPVALPVDNAPVVATDTHAPPRAQAVDLSAAAPATNGAATPAPASVTTMPAAPAAADTPTPAAAAGAPTATVSTATTTPPRALPVDLNALNTSDTTNAAPADSGTASADTTPAPAPAPAPAPPPHYAISARDSDSRPTDTHAAADKATQELIAATTPPAPVATPGTDQAAAAPVAASPSVVTPVDSAPVVSPAPTPTAASTDNPTSPSASSLTPAAASAPQAQPATAPADDSAANPAPADHAAATAGSADTFHGKRLVLTASHDSFVRVIALDGPDAGQVRYSSMLHSGQSISFNGHKYSINVGDPSAVDIALDGINYGPHSDNSAPDTFTVESHIP